MNSYASAAEVDRPAPPVPSFPAPSVPLPSWASAEASSAWEWDATEWSRTAAIEFGPYSVVQLQTFDGELFNGRPALEGGGFEFEPVNAVDAGDEIAALRDALAVAGHALQLAVSEWWAAQ